MTIPLAILLGHADKAFLHPTINFRLKHVTVEEILIANSAFPSQDHAHTHTRKTTIGGNKITNAS